MKKLKFILITLFLFYPTIVFAYSSKIIVGGENIGISIESNGVMIVGFYKVDGNLIVSNPSLKVGDYIVKVNNESINSVSDLTNKIDKYINDSKITLTIKRDSEYFDSELSLVYSDNVYKTGLYVKSGITGIGTLTYIDPETKIFGSLGHEIVDSSSNKRIEVKSGSIMESIVTGIDKSDNGDAGSKKASIKYDLILGSIRKNTSYGLFGEFTSSYDESKLMEVGEPDEVKIGDATILTVLDNQEVKEYSIKITKINEYNKIKNISFEITDEELLNKTGGVVQGMSGSPIIQNNKIIGAVTHVVVDDVKKGYGIFITTMLKEGES